MVFDRRADHPEQRRGVRHARLVLAAIAITWIALLVAAPLTIAGAPASAFVYAFGSFICHQRPERSFHLSGAQLPVCARCFGLYAGAAAGFIAIAIAASLLRATAALATDRAAARRLLALAAVPTAVTWFFEVIGLWNPANATRLVAALPLGAALAVTVNYVECVRLPRIGSRPRRTPI